MGEGADLLLSLTQSLCLQEGVVEAQSLVQQLQECGRLLDALGSRAEGLQARGRSWLEPTPRCTQVSLGLSGQGLRSHVP